MIRIRTDIKQSVPMLKEPKIGQPMSRIKIETNQIGRSTICIKNDESYQAIDVPNQI